MPKKQRRFCACDRHQITNQHHAQSLSVLCYWWQLHLTMIGVFCKTHRDYINFGLIPKDKFTRIVSVQDIRGIEFSAIIQYADWYTNESVVDAFNQLQERQPELFK